MPGIVSHHVLVLAGMGVLWWARISTARPPRRARLNHRLTRLLSHLTPEDGGVVRPLVETRVCRDCGHPLTGPHHCELEEWDGP